MSFTPAIETAANALPTIATTQGPDLQRHRREHIRWLLLLHLSTARPGETVDTSLLPALRSNHHDITRHEMQCHLEYLALKGLLSVREQTGYWHVRLTAEGIDFAEYTSNALPGIARPPRPWTEV